MVTTIISGMSLTGSGFRDWLAQRISAFILAVYFIFLCGCFFYYPTADFLQVKHFFINKWIQVFTLLALLSLLIHAWIGMWTVITDYIKSTFLQLVTQILVMIVLISYLLWGAAILINLS